MRKCKCCNLKAVNKKCFLETYKGNMEAYCNAVKLWYDKKSQILCHSCETVIESIIPRIEQFEYDSFLKSIKEEKKEITRPMRHQFWYLVNLGIINKFGEHQT